MKMESKEIEVFFKELGDIVHRRRKELGLSQAEMAESANIHRTYISDVENGKRNFSLGMLYTLSSCLGVPMKTLIEQAEDRCKKPLVGATQGNRPQDS